MFNKHISILIVDDDSDMREFLRGVFEDEEFIVYEARDGVNAVKKTIEVNPDIILLDIVMPFLNGWEALEIIRKRPASKKTPVILYSGLFEASLRFAAEPRSNCVFLQKPFAIKSMLDCINGFAAPLDHQIEDGTVFNENYGSFKG